MAGLFITGTDTDVGKTWITGRLCRCLREKGLDAGIWKPVQSGFSATDPESDRYRLKELSGVTDSVDMICPVTMNAPLAPLLAGHLEGKCFSCNTLLAEGELLFQEHDILLVEGAGGFLVPISQNELIADLAEKMGFPVLIVARHGLGTVNHCLLTIEAIQRRGLVVAGIILNGYTAEPERVESWEELPFGMTLTESSPVNPLLIEQFSDIPILGMVPRMREGDVEKPFDTYVNINEIIKKFN